MGLPICHLIVELYQSKRDCAVQEREQTILSTIPQLYQKASVLEHQMTS